MCVSTFVVTSTLTKIFNCSYKGNCVLRIDEQTDTLDSGSVTLDDYHNSIYGNVTEVVNFRNFRQFSQNLPCACWFNDYRKYYLEKDLDGFFWIRITSGTDVSVKFTLGTDVDTPYAVIYDINNHIIIDIADITQEQIITISNNQSLKNILHNINDSKFYVDTCGIYSIKVLAQLNGDPGDVDLWLRKNGTDINYSNTKNSIQDINDWKTVTFDIIDTAMMGDYYELVMSCSVTSLGLICKTGQINPTRSDIPSVKIIIYKISN